MAKGQSPRFVIHFGLPKTGTTSFQSFMQHNEALLEHELCCLSNRTDLLVRQIGQAAIAFARNGNKRKLNLLRERLTGLRQFVDQSPKDCLISNEEFSGAMPGHALDFKPFSQIETILGIFENAFQGLDPVYVFYTRPLSSWKKSVYNQVVKAAAYKETYEVFLDQLSELQSWDNLEKRVCSAVDQDRVRFFDLSAEDSSGKIPGRQLLGVFEKPFETILAAATNIPPQNKSLNSSALEFARRVNELNLDRVNHNKVKKLIVRSSDLFK